jgi:hypothetical protein
MIRMSVMLVRASGGAEAWSNTMPVGFLAASSKFKDAVTSILRLSPRKFVFRTTDINPHEKGVDNSTTKHLILCRPKSAKWCFEYWPCQHNDVVTLLQIQKNR